MSIEERPESFDIALLKHEKIKALDIHVEMLHEILADDKNTKEDYKDIIVASYDVGIEKAIEDYYDAVYR